jgi:hypothetical protein
MLSALTKYLDDNIQGFCRVHRGQLQTNGVARVRIERSPAPDDPERLIGTAYIKADLGGISTMSFWRLEHSPNEDERLPPPDLILGSNKRKLWKLGTYHRWKVKMLNRGHVRLWRAPAPDQHAPRVWPAFAREISR